MQSEGIHMELKVLHQHGWSISQLAREFGLNWRKVESHLKEILNEWEGACGLPRFVLG